MKTPEERQIETLENLAPESAENIESETPENNQAGGGDFQINENDLLAQYENLKRESAGSGNIGQLMVAYQAAYNLGAAQMLGEHWAINNEEALMLAGSTNEVMNKYVPDYSFPCELTLIGVLAAVNGQRVIISRQLEAMQQPEDQQQQEQKK